MAFVGDPILTTSGMAAAALADEVAPPIDPKSELVQSDHHILLQKDALERVERAFPYTNRSIRQSEWVRFLEEAVLRQKREMVRARGTSGGEVRAWKGHALASIMTPAPQPRAAKKGTAKKRAAKKRAAKERAAKERATGKSAGKAGTAE